MTTRKKMGMKYHSRKKKAHKKVHHRRRKGFMGWWKEMSSL